MLRRCANAACRPHLDSLMPFFVIPFPAFDPVLVHLGPLRHPLVRAGLYRRHPARLALCPRLVRNEPAMGRHRRRSTVLDFDDFILWVTLGIILGGRTRLCAVLQSAAFRRASGRDPGIVERRHVVPRRLRRLRGRRVLFARRNGIPMLSLGDITMRCGADRDFSRPHRQFHQRRTVGPARRRAVGDGIPERRAAAAPSKPAL